MARIILQGNIIHDVSNDSAKQVKIAWLDKTQDIIDLGGLVFKANTIKTVILDSDRHTTFEYDEHVAKTFEFQLRGRTFEKYCLDEQFITEDGSVVYNNVQLYNQAKFNN